MKLSKTYHIDKQFDFCYGHRVHNQELDMDLSVDGKCKCRHLHGHNGCLKIGLESSELERGMVTDFKNLECIKVLVDDILDHKFIIDINDPLFSDITGVEKEAVYWDDYNLGHIKPEVIDNVCSFISKPILNQATRDKLEGFVVVDFVPTSENLCAMFARIADQRLSKITGDRVKVRYVDFWETPKSHCRYTLGD